MTGLPEDVSWNSDKGWILYKEQFHKVKPMSNIVIGIVSVAAVLAIVFYTLILNKSKNQTVIEQNTTAEVREVNLPDGNKIWLNSNSSIEYPAKHLRSFEITVKGEVFIEISNLKYERYTLKAFNAVAIVQNASSVDIKTNPVYENIDIHVKTGAIKVYEAGSANGLALLVTQGNYCSIHRSQKLIYISANYNDNYLAWKTGRLVFDDQPLATVIDILSEYYNATIEISDKSLGFCMFSGSFEKPTLSDVLNKIHKDLNLEIKYAGPKITLSGIGC
jgi:ferric-dicitrate binding protein FerR (iron transport regulator)